MQSQNARILYYYVVDNDYFDVIYLLLKAQLIVKLPKRKSETTCTSSHRQSQMLMKERPSDLQNDTLSDSEHVLSKKEN
ncbi:MAG: hypothetical protein ACR5KV_07935 [Wolbachia sp.]